VQLLAGGRRLRATAACCELLPISRRAVCHRRLGITRRFRRPPSSVARPRQSPAACRLQFLTTSFPASYTDRPTCRE